ncbi:MAG: SDR family NAD(P)-dependent oxidoreductase [Actinomycetota bacterium]|nr:SDR family NAD(P)-dependent oxidoreductase [Actinomycetota bacterium]
MSNSSIKKILITGGTSGLGLAMATALIGANYEVAITSRQRERVEKVAASLGERALGVVMDVTDESSVESGLAKIEKAFGQIDMLVNNAGLGMVSVNPRFMSDPAPFYEVSLGGFDGVVDSKVRGTFLLSKALVPRMLSQGGGRVVVISMNTSTMERKGFIPYGPAGAAVEAMAKIMAADLVDTAVRVNILLPGGASATGMIPPDVTDDIRAQLLPPSVMANPILFLASEEAKDIHGQRLIATTFDDWLATFRGSSQG